MDNAEPKDSRDLELCPVCQEEIKIYALGKCDHPVCFKCSIRMRLLCEQFHCPICRSDIRQVAMVTSKVNFESINFSSLCMDGKNKIFSESMEIQDMYHDLMKHTCSMCETPQEFKSFTQLRYHVSRVHKLMSCKLCTENLNLFSSERKFYNTQDMVRHKKTGDEDEKSYRGHPLCEFCEERYFDKDALNLHLRKDHYYCQFCEKNGITGEFYCTYEDLKKHFKVKHILCEEGECATAQWTHAFDHQIDYRAHVVKNHKDLLDKPEFKNFMHLNVTLGHEEHRDKRRNYQQRREPQVNSDVSSAVASVVRQGYINTAPQAVVDLIKGRTSPTIPPTQEVPQLSTNEFPAIRASGTGGATGGNKTLTVLKDIKTYKNATARFDMHSSISSANEFPALSGKKKKDQIKENQSFVRATKAESQNQRPGVKENSKEIKHVRYQPQVERQLEKLGTEDEENHYESEQSSNVQSNTCGDKWSPLAKPMKQNTLKENTPKMQTKGVSEEFPDLPIKKPLKVYTPCKQANKGWSSGDIAERISDSAKETKVNPQKIERRTESSIHDFPSLPINKSSKAVPLKLTNGCRAESTAGKVAEKKDKLTKPLIQMLAKTSNQEICTKPKAQKLPKAHDYPSLPNNNTSKTEPSREVSGWEDSAASKVIQKKKNTPRPKPQKPQKMILDQEFPSLPSRIVEERILKVSKATKVVSEEDLEIPMERMSKLVLAEKNRSTLESLKRLLNKMNDGIVEAEEFYASCTELLTSSFFEENFKDISACVTSFKDRAKVTALYQAYYG